MAETIWWCETHSDLVRPCPLDPAEPCQRSERVLSAPGELIDPENLDYEAARDAMVKAHPPLEPPYYGIDELARVAVVAALGLREES